MFIVKSLEREAKSVQSVATVKFLILCMIQLCGSTNMLLRDGEPCQFWPGSLYFDDVCYKIIDTSSTWEEASNACQQDHHQSQVAQFETLRPVRFLSLYSLYLTGHRADFISWVGANYTAAGGSWLNVGDPMLLPPPEAWMTSMDACLVLDTGQINLTWMECTIKDLSTICQIELHLEWCPLPESSYFKGSCYAIPNSRNRRPQAARACRDFNNNNKGYLAELTTLEEINFVALIARVFMYDSPDRALFIGGKRDSSDKLKWTNSGKLIDEDLGDWHAGEPNGENLQPAENCLVLSLRSELQQRPLWEDYRCAFNLSAVCEINKYEERYVAALPLLELKDHAPPEVTLTISSLNTLFESSALLVVYHSQEAKYRCSFATFRIGGNKTFSRTFANTDHFLTESGLGTRTAVITSDITFLVTFTYSFSSHNREDVFTSSVLYPLGPASAHFFIVTSTSACAEIPVAVDGHYTNPLSSNPECKCETFLLLVAVDSSDVTSVRLEFPPGTKFTFDVGEFEVEDPASLKITLQQYGTAFIRSESDLSGTFIEGSQNLNVFTGYTVQGKTSSADCSASVHMMQAKPVTEGSLLFYTAPYELPPPDGVTSLENYRVVALEDNTDVVVETLDGTEVGTMSLTEASEIREFSIPNTAFYVIRSNLPVLVYRLSFASPNMATGINDVITPCLAPLFSKYSIVNFAEHVFARDDLDYIHLVLNIKRPDDPTRKFALNGLSYENFQQRVYNTSDALIIRLNVTGLDRIQITASDMKNPTTAGIVCAGRTGASGYCTDLEARHHVRSRENSPVNVTALSERNFHEYPINRIRFGFDEPVESSNSSNATEATTVQGVSSGGGGVILRPTLAHPPAQTVNNVKIPQCIVRMLPNITRAEAETLATEIKKRLYVNVRETSAFLRKRISAQDDRPASTAMGFLGVSLLCLTFFLITLPDMLTVAIWICRSSNK